MELNSLTLKIAWKVTSEGQEILLSEESLDITEEKIFHLDIVHCPSSVHKTHILEVMTHLSHLHMKWSTLQ